MLGLSATAKSVSQFASAVTLATQINTEAADVYAFSTFKDHLKSHVSDAMSNFRKRNGITTLTRSLIGVNDFTSVSPATKVNPIDYAYKGPPACAAYNTTVSYTDKKGKTVSTANAAYEINSCRVNNFLNSKEPMHMMVSRSIAADYASLCSVSNMKKIIIDVFAATETKMKNSNSNNTETKGKPSEQLVEAKDAVIEAKAEADKAAAASEAAVQAAAKAKTEKKLAIEAKDLAVDAKKDAEEAKSDAEKANQ